MIENLAFTPFPFLSGPNQQTIVGSLSYFGTQPSSESKEIQLPDGDRLMVEITTPDGWTPKQLSVLMVHGLAGSHRSTYLVRLTKRFASLGIRSIRCNMRGCGSGKGLAKNLYHSGRSGDLLEVLKVLKRESPKSPIHLIGFSMGGNIALKMCGELSARGSDFLSSVIAISPPVDLYSSVRLINQSFGGFYDRYFCHLLVKNIRYLHRKFIDLPKVNFPEKLTLYQFDDLYTAPRCGFANAIDYYTQSSSARLVPSIQIPCKILFSEDDPFIVHSSLDELKTPDNIQIFKTKQGGHMGYLGTPFKRGAFRFLDSTIESWLEI